jgi:hypothetical protein
LRMHLGSLQAMLKTGSRSVSKNHMLNLTCEYVWICNLNTWTDAEICLFFLEHKWGVSKYQIVNDGLQVFLVFSCEFWNSSFYRPWLPSLQYTGWRRETGKFEISRKTLRKLTKLYLILKMCSTRVEISLGITF